jgi:beta-glucosidase
VGWSKVHLNVGESKQVSVSVDPLYLSIYDVDQHGWRLVPGNYTFKVGGSSADLPLAKEVGMK